MGVKNHIKNPENWSRRNNHQFISILEDSEREDVEEIENITTTLLQKPIRKKSFLKGFQNMYEIQMMSHQVFQFLN